MVEGEVEVEGSQMLGSSLMGLMEEQGEVELTQLEDCPYQGCPSRYLSLAWCRWSHKDHCQHKVGIVQMSF